ncbi:MAG TPA: hypothetical protein VK968_19475 [Roseimicrobium sp.]|nr:hypothetical protein [Roseimicrobium sp.]
MKKVLSLLVTYIFLETQMWALSGGPIFADASSTALTGSYAGSFVQKTITSGGGFPLDALAPPSLGTFSINVQVEGLATGSTVFFQGNVAFTGNIDAAADPAKKTIDGIIQASSIGSQFVITPAVPAVPASATVVVLPPLFIPTVVITPAVPAQAAVTTGLDANGTLRAKVSGRRGIPNSGFQAVDGVQRPGNGQVGGVDPNTGLPVSMGAFGDKLSGEVIINAQFLNTAIAGPIFTANQVKYSISGIRQTNVP